MPVEIRIPRDDDRDDITRLLATALNFPLATAIARKHTFPLGDMRCAYVDGRPVANAAEFRFTQWFGGRGLATSGIWGVVTEPEHRGEGLASVCLGTLIDDARRRGDPLTSLFPAVLDPYRRSGYELAGTFDDHRIALDDLPEVAAADLPRVELVDVDRDLEAIRSAYRTWAKDRNGIVEPNDPAVWRDRFLDRPWDEASRAIVIREGDDVTGFAAFTRSSDPSGHLGDIGFGLRSNLFFMTDERALRAFIAYARGYRGVGSWLQWAGPPNDPLTLLVGVQAVTAVRRYRWMLRILDVASAFEGRGYPAIDAEATFAVDDPRYPENAGPWRLVVWGGEAKIGPADGHDRRPIPIGALSSIYSGYLRPADAVILGIFDADDPAVGALTTMLDGPDPWTPFFF
jgi:predicted acetyltransferase